MRRSLVALGGNVGPVEETFASAVDSLRLVPGIAVDAVSSFHLTPPVGADAGDAYLNAAISLRTRLEPLELFDRLQEIEYEFGRVRERRWGPRTLDLDLVTFGEEVIEEPRLRVPHPGCWYRRFVLDPLVEIAADVVHPLKRQTFGELRERLLPRPLPIGLSGGDALNRQTIAERLQGAFSAETVALVDESCDPAIVLVLDRAPVDSALPVEAQGARLPVPGDDIEAQFGFARDVLVAALSNAVMGCDS